MSNPNGIVITGTTAYVSNSTGGTGIGSVSIIDLSVPLSSHVTSVAGDSNLNQPYSMAISSNGHTVYIPNIGNSTVSILDTDLSSPSYNDITGYVIDYGFNNPQDVAFTPNGTTAYVLNKLGGTLGVGFINIVDTATNAVTGVVADTNNTFNNPDAIAITPDGTTAYVANFVGNSVSVIDIATNTVTEIVTDLNPATFNEPVAIAITPNGLYAYVVNYNPGTNNSGSVSVIDINPSSQTYNHVLYTVTDINETFFNPQDLAITPDGTTIYVVNFSGQIQVSIVDVATHTVINSISNGSLSSCYAIAITPDGQTAYVVNQSPRTVAIIDIADRMNPVVEGLVTDAGSTISTPYDIVILPNGQAAYVVNNGNYTVSIINTQTNKVTGSMTDLSFYYNPNAMAIEPNGEFGYVTNATGNDVCIIYLEASIQAPASMLVQCIVNNFLTRTDIINVITWTVPTSGPQPVKYNIYRDAALTQLVVSSSASNPLEYYDYNRAPGATYSYYIVSIDENNNVSAPISKTITTV